MLKSCFAPDAQVTKISLFPQAHVEHKFIEIVWPLKNHSTSHKESTTEISCILTD